MKAEMLAALAGLKADLLALRRSIKKEAGKTIAKRALRTAAESLADRWVEELRSPLEHKFHIDPAVIKSMSDGMKKLHILSRPNNSKQSYVRTLNELLNDFDNKFVLPIKQLTPDIQSVLDLEKLIPGLPNQDESEYLGEAIACARSGFRRAAVVMGWCAAIDRVQRKLLSLGLEQLNKTSVKLKAVTSGKFKRWNKEFAISTLAELQTIFDSDLIVLLEGMGIIDGNQAERLDIAFQYRNHSAHPGEAPIEDAHLTAFFADVNAIVFQNPKLQV